MRFYHLGLTQMHQLEDNSTALIDLVAERDALKDRMLALNLETEQTRFTEEDVAPFKKATD